MTLMPLLTLALKAHFSFQLSLGPVTDKASFQLF